MPRRWPGYKRPKLEDEGIVNHLISMGIDPKEFSKFVIHNIPPSSMQKFFPKPDGTMYTRATLAKWARLYREQEL